MKKKFTFLMAACIMLLTIMVLPGKAVGQTKDPVEIVSFSRSGSTDSYTSGQTFTVSARKNSGFYDDGSYDPAYLQLKGSSPYWTTTPTSISLIAKLGGGSARDPLNYYVYVVLLDSNGDEIASTETVVTTKITTQTGSEFTVSIPATNNVYGVKIRHAKEQYYNVRYYSFSLSYVAGSSTYTVEYDCNGGTSGCPENVTDIDPDDNEITLAAGPSRTGYTFAGWNDGSNTYSAGADYTVEGDVTMTAQWTPKTHNINLSGTIAHGTVGGYTNPVAYGTEITLTYTHNTGEYYYATFASDDVSLTDGTTFTMPDDNVTITVTENELPKYTVTYSDGGSVTEEHYHAGVTLASRPGDGTYTFAGWTTSNIASETTNVPTIIPTNETYYPTGNITLYPVYTRTVIGETVWQKVSDFSTVTNGTYALITEGGYAFNGTITSGRGQVTEDAFSFTNGVADSAPTGTCQLTLTTVTNGFTIKNSSNQYLYIKAASEGNLDWKNSESNYWFDQLANSNHNLRYSANNGYLRSLNNTTFRTYSGTSNSPVFLVKQATNITTYYVSSLTSIAVPTFDPTSKNFSTASLPVTITAPSDCYIKYTTNDWESYTVTLSNTVTIEIDGTTTVKAKAKNGGNESAEASETYTKVYAVTLISNGVQKAVEEVIPTHSITLLAPDNVPDGFAFMGWTATPSTPSTTVSTNYTPTGNVTLYASFAQVLSRSYDKVTSASGLTEGEYIITAYYGSKYYTIKSNVKDTDNPDAYEQAVTNDAITGDVTDITWSFKESNNLMIIKSTSNNYYLNTTNAAQGVKIDETDTDSWTISFNNTENCFTMKSTNGGGSRYFSGFISSGIFKDWRNYSWETTGSYQYITLFKKSETYSTERYIRVYPSNTTATADIEITGPTVIESGSVLNMGEYKLTNSTAANLIIEDGGQLIVNNSGVQATVKKTVAGYDGGSRGGDDWCFIASPVSGSIDPTSVDNMIPLSGNYDLYRFNEAADLGWENYKAHTAGFQLVNGLGYLYANANGVDLSYKGEVTPSASPFSVDLDFTSSEKGWNLVGNPFTCNAYVNRSYYKMNAQGNDIELVSAYTTTSIAPCTGVLVRATGTEQTVTFSKNVPDGSANNGDLQIALAQTVTTRGENSSQTIDNAIVSFNEGSQLGKFYFGSQNANLYIPMDNEEYAIVSSSSQGEMPINFKAHRDGQYTITVNPQEVEMGYLHLIDNIAGVDVDLLANPSYTFNARYDDYESRFRLVFSANMVNADLNDDFAFFSNGQLVIANEGEAILQVIDVNGRIVATESINGTCSKAVNAKAGVYVLRLINGTDVKTQKIIVK